MATKARALITAALLTPAAVLADITLQNPSFATVAFIREDGRVEDASFRVLGYFREGGRVEDARFKALGYIHSDGRVEDASFRTVGYVRADGRIEDASFRTVGYVRDGVVTDEVFKTVLHFTRGKVKGGTAPALAAFVFFFSRSLFPEPSWEIGGH